MSYKKTRIEAVVLTIVLLGAMFLAPASSFVAPDETNLIHEQSNLIYSNPSSTEDELPPFMLDRNYDVITDPAPISKDESNDDGGIKRDAGDEHKRATALFAGELIDDTPGRGRTGKLDASDEDWYYIVVCEGQDIVVTMTPPSGHDYDLSLWDDDENLMDISENTGSTQETVTYTADYTGEWMINISYVSGTGEGQYAFTVDLNGQNDAGTAADAGDTFADATLITQGTYNGYLDMNDAYDWYKFDVADGDGIHFDLNMRTVAYLADFDIHLYNPSEELVHEEKYYYDDDLYYPIDETGQWRVKIDIFPGWVDIPQPTEWKYYAYGSGPYELEYSIETNVPSPPDPIPQQQITPIAKTFTIADDPTSNKDEYGYLASIPACNYLDSGDRYLAPVIYEGDDTSTNYYGTEYDRGVVDDTTQYVIDDWNDYLTSHGKTAVQYDVPSDPIEAAAEIATEWGSSDLAVVAVDGSGYEDNVKTAISRTRTLKREVEVITLHNDDDQIIDIGGTYGYPMLLNLKWCAINVSMSAGGAEPNLNAIIPHFMNFMGDWWPYTYDGDGPKVDIFYPVTKAGIWTAGTNRITGDWDFDITKYAGHRYRFRVTDSDSVINVKVETDTPSDLLVYLIDPEGHLRAPDVPQWNGPVNPIHVWNGCHFDPEVHGFGPWRTWDPEPHTEFSAEVLYPEKGRWTAVVVPRDAEGPDIGYTITGEITTTNPDRADADISAANAAVIASQEHVPLLYVTEDSVPSETTAALNALGVNKVIFVERGEIGSAVKGDLPTLEADLTTMQEIIDYIKAYDNSENYITITSLKYSKGDSTDPAMQNGYFAPAAMIAAYHCSPVLRIADAVQDGTFKTEVNPAGMADRIETWRLWSGDFYHGSRSTGHLPEASEPVEQDKLTNLIQMIKFLINGEGDLPPFGLDAKRYWNEAMHDGIHDWIEDLGLDLAGPEGYCFVAPRKNINLVLPATMMGNNSYAGQIVGETPAYTSAMVARNILYPALIYANPNRDITTTQLMNFPDGGTWKTNDGVSTAAYSSRFLKKAFGSHGRTYEGHCLWDAHLERMNDGASAMYYSGHGTGGSGTSAQYYQTDFCNYPEQIWWDSWRGYSYDNWKMPRHNGRVWYNAAPANLYDIVHYDYADELFENLRSNAVFYMSCTTADADGPMVYLDHGAVIYYGNAGSGLCPQADLQDDVFFDNAMINGEAIGPAFAKTIWLHYRDFTTGDPTSMYGPSSLYPVTTVQVIYGDPNLVIYSPEWTSPSPIDA
jgi:hypothetical protein